MKIIHLVFSGMAIAMSAFSLPPCVAQNNTDVQHWRLWRQRVRSRLQMAADKVQKQQASAERKPTQPATYYRHYKWTSPDGLKSVERQEWSTANCGGNNGTYYQSQHSFYTTNDSQTATSPRKAKPK